MITLGIWSVLFMSDHPGPAFSRPVELDLFLSPMLFPFSKFLQVYFILPLFYVCVCVCVCVCVYVQIMSAGACEEEMIHLIFWNYSYRQL